MIINAKDLILGRLSTHVAKEALLGTKIQIVNCQDAVIVGVKSVVFSKYKTRQARTTPIKGPFIPKTADRFVKRSIRGMLPYKKERGREAFKRIKCFKAIPESLRDKELKTFENINIHNTKNINFVKVQDICTQLGGN
jgi:large subunit ribosomal protein L13